MPLYHSSDAEVEVFTFWVDRLRREFRDPLDQQDQDKLTSKDKRILKNPYVGLDFDEFLAPR